MALFDKIKSKAEEGVKLVKEKISEIDMDEIKESAKEDFEKYVADSVKLVCISEVKAFATGFKLAIDFFVDRA